MPSSFIAERRRIARASKWQGIGNDEKDGQSKNFSLPVYSVEKDFLRQGRYG